MATATLFVELENQIHSSDFEQALLTTQKILQINSEDKEALHCKIVSLIKLNKSEEALTFFESQKQLIQFFPYEYCYCLYRNKKIKEALIFLDSQNLNSSSSLLLKAQIFFRLEQYEQSIETCEQLEKIHQISSPELTTNLIAALVNCGKVKEAKQLFEKQKDLIGPFYEIDYNIGCGLLTEKNYVEAEKYLNSALEICQKNGENDELSTEEIETEKLIIQAQLACLYQLTNRIPQASELFKKIYKKNPSDSIIAAVVGNNIATLQSNQNLANSLKKMKKIIINLQSETRITKKQKETLLKNYAILLLQSKKFEEFKEEIQKFENQFEKNNSCLAILNASLLIKESNYDQAIKLIEDQISSQSNIENLDFARLQLYICQIYLMKNTNESLTKAFNILSNSNNFVKNLPFILSARLAINYQINGSNKSLVIEVDNALTFWKEQSENNQSDIFLINQAKEFYFEILIKSIEFFRKIKDFEAATQFSVRVLENKNKLNQSQLCSLILIISKSAPTTAEQLVKHLSKPSESTEKFNLDQLENFTQFEEKKIKTLSKATKQLEPSVESNKDIQLKKDKKKKKKKNKRLPKNFNPNKTPDPERWLPKQERTLYKRKMKKLQQAKVNSNKKSITTGNTNTNTIQAATEGKTTSAKSKIPPKAGKRKRS
eukprot:TRINITY_DN7494_c1_g1_i1.p1 TRINITY_DN7494_c1_g1~~TRINITY_DN7494_c1_g1_i1.p1  ORF type:complete len:677 (-),score=242.99 TRINITY_DN7494_c1_g1_i1:82-2064(-)